MEVSDSIGLVYRFRSFYALYSGDLTVLYNLGGVYAILQEHIVSDRAKHRTVFHRPRKGQETYRTSMGKHDHVEPVWSLVILRSRGMGGLAAYGTKDEDFESKSIVKPG